MWPGRHNTQTQLVKDSSEVRTGGCLLRGPGASREGCAVQVREGTDPAPCLKGSLNTAVSKNPVRAQPPTDRYWQGPGHKAGQENQEGWALAITSSIQLAHTCMHRAGN